MVWLRPLSRDAPLLPSDESEVTSGLRAFGSGALRQPENFDHRLKKRMIRGCE